MKFDNELLKEVLAISAPSGNEDEAQTYIEEWVTKNIPNAFIDIDDKGNLYVTKGQAVKYPTFVGHLDDVHDYYAKKVIVENKGWLYAMDEYTMQQIGTAGDDKVGMYLCLEALRTYDNVKCFFPVEEEWGTVGTLACDMEFFNDSQYVIQSDRQKAEDIVVGTYGCNLTSKAFDKVARKVGKKYEYKLCNTGGLTDVVTLKDRGLDVCAINIASGYYRPHTDSEIVCISDVSNMIDTVADLVKALGDKEWKHKLPKKKVYEPWQPETYKGKTYGAKGYSKFNPDTNTWVDEDTTKEDSGLYWCDDCAKEYQASEMSTFELCNECAEWYEGEYGYKIPDADKLENIDKGIDPAKPNDYLVW